jgi:hypothetical protein
VNGVVVGPATPPHGSSGGGRPASGSF